MPESTDGCRRLRERLFERITKVRTFEIIAPATCYRRGHLYPIIFMYLYNGGLLSPHTRASSDAFILHLYEDGIMLQKTGRYILLGSGLPPNLLGLGVAMLVYEDNLVRDRRLQFLYLLIDVLLAFVGGVVRISIITVLAPVV